MKKVLRLIFLVVVAIVLSYCVRNYVIERISIASASMEPTLEVGDELFVEKITYYFRTPKYNEIVVFQCPVESDKILVKRIIGLPGDVIAIYAKIVFRNSQKLDEPYVKFTRKNEMLVGDNMAPLKVPEDCVFVLGDNRDESDDSRDWKDPQTGEFLGFIPINKIRGKVMGKY